ncbi:Uncharacterised protein [Klebsiella pneumoniae]|nr:Uncharacterised protein [Klebsiella pneumoniae]
MHVVDRAPGRQAQADALGTDRGDQRVDDLQQEPRAVLQATAIGIAASVAGAGEELVDQVAIGAMQFDQVEAGVERVACGADEFVADPADVFQGHFPRRVGGRHGPAALAIGDEHLGLGLDRRGRDRRLAAGLQRAMRHAPDMPELRGDQSAGGVHRLGDLAPAGQLRLAVDTGGVGVALAEAGNLRALADDQPGAGALRIVESVQGGRHVARLLRPGAGHRRHDDAVAQGQVAYGERGEEQVGHGLFLSKAAGRWLEHLYRSLNNMAMATLVK